MGASIVHASHFTTEQEEGGRGGGGGQEFIYLFNVKHINIIRKLVLSLLKNKKEKKTKTKTKKTKKKKIFLYSFGA